MRTIDIIVDIEEKFNIKFLQLHFEFGQQIQQYMIKNWYSEQDMQPYKNFVTYFQQEVAKDNFSLEKVLQEYTNQFGGDKK